MGGDPEGGGKGSGKLKAEMDKLKARIESIKKGAGKATSTKGGGKGKAGDKGKNGQRQGSHRTRRQDPGKKWNMG